MPRPRATELYRQTEARVTEMFPDDQEAREFCLADWPEGDEHLIWLIEASDQEIRDWVAAGSR